MINNKLLKIVVLLIPLVVISFIFKNKTNFILKEKKEERPIIIKILYKGSVLELELEEYIVGVVAGEMPALFHMEALKAQAVASRTYALYRKKEANGKYDLTSTTSNQIYLSLDDMKEKWKSKYNEYKARIQEAVNKTKGEVITYNKEIIDALYFSMSAGKTQDVKSVFKEDLDYLKSTESIYDNDTLNGYKVEKEISVEDFIRTLSLNCIYPKIDTITYNESGYVKELIICNQTFSGNEFRKKLGLRSANFKININDKILITTYGYGHGVGMSQYGANGYAKAGYSYQEILKHYYTGVEIKKINDV